MLRQALLALSASHQARDLIMATPVTRDVVARFVAGETAADALAVTERLLADGRLVTIDFLGEDTTDPDQAAAVADEYVRLLGRLAAAGLAGHGRAEVSVKPTAVGLGLRRARREDSAGEHRPHRDGGPQRRAPRSPWTWRTTPRVDATLRLVAELRADFPDLGCVIQSYLRRSADDCRALAVAGSRVRLCKGAYQAPDGVGLASRAEVDLQLRAVPADPARRARLPDAGHPRPAADQDRGDQGRSGGPRGRSFEYQMLYGIRPGRAGQAGSRGRPDARLPAVRQRLVRLPGPPAGRAAREPGLLPAGARQPSGPWR